MNQFETWCEASRAADKDRSRQPGPTVDDLRLIRQSLGWSQQKMANYAETPISTYRKWEQEQRKPPKHVPRLIARLLIAEGVMTREQVDDIVGVN